MGGSDGGSFPGFETAAFSLCSHTEREGASELPVSLLMTPRGSSLTTSRTPDPLPEAASPSAYGNTGGHGLNTRVWDGGGTFHAEGRSRVIETDIGELRPQARTCRGMPANSGSRRGAAGSSRGARGPANAPASDLSLQNSERMNLSLGRSACAVPLRQPEEATTTAWEHSRLVDCSVRASADARNEASKF